jgi:hypothetical protein
MFPNVHLRPEFRSPESIKAAADQGDRDQDGDQGEGGGGERRPAERAP